MKTPARKASHYLNIGQWVRLPADVPAPIIYSDKHPNGETVREGEVCEHLLSGGVAVKFGEKQWDYSNKESLQFAKVYPL